MQEVPYLQSELYGFPPLSCYALQGRERHTKESSERQLEDSHLSNFLLPTVYFLLISSN
jgi:hypothetical protein